ncbi:S1 RNA-binding domain-containing protein [Butyricicoccus sp.]|uniref:S1 RNA-binding domain-containing protein n=1 Tax=Butyricicoccus sp. TaxID=2049021 RepID=UPI003F136716
MHPYYAPESLNTSIPHREEIYTAMQDGSILEATAIRCDAQHNLIVALEGMTGIMPREECALGIDTGQTREIAILSRVGKPVCFQVQRIEQQTAYLSRRSAQQQALRHLMTRHRPGDIIDVRVTHLEPFGAFVDAGCGIVSLIGIENLSVSRIFHPSDRVRIGQKLKAVISSLDPDAGRICLTHRELLGTWEENSAQFTPGETVCGIVRSVEDYGVFVELTPNLSGLAEQRFPVTPGETVSCYIKSILPERMKIKLNLIDHINQSPASPPPLTYFIESGHLSRWQYSPSSCTTRLVQTEFDPPTIEDF